MRLANRFALLALLLGLSARGLGAREPATTPEPIPFQRLAIPDDTPAHLVSALAQDHEGFLWIGTQAGLVRYDGYQFKVYKTNPNDPRSLGGSYVRLLFVSRDGRLWVGSFSDGLSVYDPRTEAFTRYSHDAKLPGSLANNRVEAVVEDRTGRIWIATYEGLDRLEPESGRIVHFRHDPGDPRGLADDAVRGLLVDREGRLWVGSRDGLQRWLGEGTGFERIASDPRQPGSLAGQFVSKLYQDSRGRIWIGTMEHGAAVLDPAGGALRRLAPHPGAGGLSHFWVYGFAEVDPGTVWIATFGGGIDVVSPADLRVIARLRHDPEGPEGPEAEGTIGSDRIGALLRDRSGVVWVGTWGQGLDRYDPAAQAFRALRAARHAQGEGLSHPEAVRALALRDGTIWVGTNGNGVDVLDAGLHRIGGHRPAPGRPGALSDGSVTCLAQGPDGTVWVATLDGTLHRQTPGSGRFERLTRAEGLAGGPIRALTFGAGGELWAGSAEGLTRIQPDTLRITAYRHSPDDPSTLSGHAVEAIARGPDGTLWVGTESGLNAFDPRRGKAVRIPFQPGRRDGLPAPWVPDLMIARDGRLWVATPGGAAILLSWDGRNATFEPVAERMGRPPAPVESLIEDDEGQVWLGPRLRVDPRSWSWRDFGPADGCELHDFFIASRSRTPNGALLFGSPGGLLVVRPERIAPWRFAPPLVATALRVGGVERPGAARLVRLTLAPNERGFRLDFAALDFTAPTRNQYRYRLEGYDEEWTRTDAAHRTLVYNGLPPGRYELRIDGTNRAGLWSPHEIRLAVRVLPAYYQTGWFRALAALAAAGLIYGGVRLRVRRLEARSRGLEEQVRERTLSLEERGRELAEAYARIEEASLTDPLTGLRNRRYLEQSIAADLEITTRRHREGHAAGGEADLVFLLLDLDHFKKVNDTHGHAVGDQLLRKTADLLRATFRTSDHLVRWGGEEFLVIARFVDRGHAPELAEKIRAAVAAHQIELADGTMLRRTVSLGYAVYPFAPDQPQAASWPEIVALADAGLYEAKRSGRDRWVGIELAEGADPEEALRRFREDPGGVATQAGLRVRAAGRFQ